jgi:hypothetical protein
VGGGGASPGGGASVRVESPPATPAFAL